MILAITLTGANDCGGGEGTQPRPVDDGDFAQPEPQPVPVPRPNPDSGPNRPKTPGPAPADPKPHREVRYTIMVVFSPSNEFVEITWTAGSKGGGPIERSRHWFTDGTVPSGQTVTVAADWTEISYRRLGNQGLNGSIVVVIEFDGVQACKDSTPPHGRPRGAMCSARA